MGGWLSNEGLIEAKRVTSLDVFRSDTEKKGQPVLYISCAEGSPGMRELPLETVCKGEEKRRADIPTLTFLE